ncbi:MAG: CCA tRNA nucleotidyltransferase [Chroococcidiopsidaceae cyanobacterium CP_BM_ER_R8_30]|nr:CCA tRNA nucleotidyltransferase [Chroococcidiopsidaceae cyanobacterium CP_BM_ER_R8_30]
MHEYSLSALSPQNWPFSLECLPKGAYLVGGAVRDALLGRCSEYLDLDFVLPADAVKIARQIADRYQAGFVLLDAERQIARVVFEQATADFAQQEGFTLAIDLQRRDFTVNAIAYNPHTGELLDPLKGYADLQQGLLCMISLANLQDDPLRLLRAYRQAAQLSFTIEPDTQAAIRQLAPQLARVAAERVQVELSYLLNSSQGSLWLKTAWEDGLIGAWFPNATRASCDRLIRVDSAVTVLAETWPQLGIELAQSVRDRIKTPLSAIAKLACLVAPNSKLAEEELQRLKYSRTEIRAVTTTLKSLMHLQTTYLIDQMSLQQQYFLFRKAEAVFPALAVLAIATGTTLQAIAPLIDHYLTPNDPIAHPTPLLTGTELMQALQLKPGPQIGQLLTEIALAQIGGNISTPDEALKLASWLVNQQ